MCALWLPGIIHHFATRPRPTARCGRTRQPPQSRILQDVPVAGGNCWCPDQAHRRLSRPEFYGIWPLASRALLHRVLAVFQAQPPRRDSAAGGVDATHGAGAFWPVSRRFCPQRPNQHPVRSPVARAWPQHTQPFQGATTKAACLNTFRYVQCSSFTDKVKRADFSWGQGRLTLCNSVFLQTRRAGSVLPLTAFKVLKTLTVSFDLSPCRRQNILP